MITYHYVHDDNKDAKSCKHPEYDVRESITADPHTKCLYCHKPVHRGIVLNEELIVTKGAEIGRIGGHAIMRNGQTKHEKPEKKEPVTDEP